MKKEYTLDDLGNAISEERKKHFTILNYLLNKNSHPLPRGVDHKKLFDDLQEFETYLMDMI